MISFVFRIWETKANPVKHLKLDDSTSMEFEQGGERKRALKEVLHLLADLYGAVSDDMRGIKAIRFLNGIDNIKADDIKRRGDIDDVIDNHQFEGLTCIGAGLMRKILKPFVFSDEPWVKGTSRKLRKVERPLLVMVITDGAVSFHPPLSIYLRIRILNCMHGYAG